MKTVIGSLRAQQALQLLGFTSTHSLAAFPLSIAANTYCFASEGGPTGKNELFFVNLNSFL
jgi:hypothetical protein